MIAWGEAECKRQKLSSDKTDDMKKVLKTLPTLIRFPCMGLQDIAVSVEKTKLLEQTQLLALFTYLGQKTSDSKPSLDDCLKSFSAKDRKPRMPVGAFTFDDTRKGYQMTVSNENTTIKQTSGTTTWNTALCKEWVKSGVHVVRFRIDADPSNHWMFLGVAGRSYSNYSSYCGSDSYGWAYTRGGTTARGYQGGSSKNYGSLWNVGDVITMTIDMDSKSLSYKQNETDFSTCYSNLPDEVTVAVTTYDTGDCVTLI